LLVIDKPQGLTSFAVVAAVRKAAAIKKVGHAGTLDPMATGVLVVALGQATRLVRWIQEEEKEYVAGVTFGIATDSLDADGEEIGRAPMNFTRVELEGALAGFRGEISQVPPMVSALKVKGERLYELARTGREVERDRRQVRISELELVDFDGRPDFPLATLRVVASKGTYIRTLADDIAITLGGRAHLHALRRQRIGPFDLAGALSFDLLTQWTEHLRPPAEAVVGMARWWIGADEVDAAKHGRALAAPEGMGPWALIGSDGNLRAVYKREGDRAIAEVVLT
jgi:tRNA pseudouridine55 synthase